MQKILKDQFVTHLIAQLFKDLGFVEECLTIFMKSPLPPYKWLISSVGHTLIHITGQNDSHKLDFTGYVNNKCEHFRIVHIAAPTWQQAVNWLQTEHNAFIVPNIPETANEPLTYTIKIFTKKGTRQGTEPNLEKAILKTIELIKLDSHEK